MFKALVYFYLVLIKRMKFIITVDTKNGQQNVTEYCKLFDRFVASTMVFRHTVYDIQ